MKTAPEIKAVLVSDQVYDVLANKIFSGELSANSPLRIRDIAEEMGTSAMPVREAIGRLVKNGLAVSMPNRGARVREFTTKELIDIYDVRALLEVEAARAASPRITEGDLQTMKNACDRMYRAVVQNRVHDALDEDEVLLRTLYRASGNPVLLDHIELLWTQCRAYKVIGAQVAIQNHDDSLWSFQPRLIEAAEAGDTELAVRVTQESVAAARRRLENETT